MPTHYLDDAFRRLKFLEEENSKLREDRNRLQKALRGLVGMSTRKELEVMGMTVRMTPAPEEDKVVMIDAIDALLASLKDE